MKFNVSIFVVLIACSTCVAEIDFDTEIVPLLSKAGCNAAACHGGAAGQAGFRLSLFGGDPEFDHRTIVHELEGRRVNQIHPQESLVLAKPTGQLDHGGGEVLDLEDDAAVKIADWISSGAQRLRLRQLDQLNVSPARFVAEALPASLQLNVMATFSDGEVQDVTDVAVYGTQNESALRLGEFGNLVLLRPGQHVGVVRFGGQVRTVVAMAPVGTNRPVFDASDRRNWIDDEINETLQLLRLEPAPSADDATFLRRLSLDLTGRLPRPSAIEEFIGDTDKSKRSQEIARLLASDEFTEYWTYRLATHLRLRKPATDEVAANAFYDWIKVRVSDDAGWDRIATDLLLSEGDTHENGAATVHRFFATAREQAEYVSEVFMGVRLRCANCHNHPLDQWTQDDYHGLAAVFAGLERGQVVRYTDRGKVTHPRTGRAAVPRIPGDQFIGTGLDERKEFAAWLTDKGNPYFARAMVGRVWESLMGRGLVTPVNDHRATNPATHPDLMVRLADVFVEQNYKLRPLIQQIRNSVAYARNSTAPNRFEDDRFYSHAISKELSAEVLADAISDVTGVGDAYGTQSNTRAINVVDRSKTSAKLQFLGQCLPGEGCLAGSASGRGIASKLHLMNGELVNEKIVSDHGDLARFIMTGTSTNEIIKTFYLQALSRPPTETEFAKWSQRIDYNDDPKDRRERCEDFLWALMNCHEFTTNR